MFDVGPWRNPTYRSNIKERYYEYLPLETDALARKEDEDNRTHYHYDYQVIDHDHYVTLNFLEGVGRQGLEAGMLAQQPFRIKDKGIEDTVRDTFAWNIDSKKIKEVFHYHYDYTYNQHDHYIQSFDITSLPWWMEPHFFEEPKVEVDVELHIKKDEPIKPA